VARVLTRATNAIAGSLSDSGGAFGGGDRDGDRVVAACWSGSLRDVKEKRWISECIFR
jgi:hypothetical protein